MSANLSLPDQIRQLSEARGLVLSNPKYYPTVVQGILPILGTSGELELRRWGSEFLAEAFATPALSSGEKETMQLFVLDTLLSMLENPKEDARVVASLVQVAASIYPLALRWNMNNSYDENSWQKMTAIKHRVLQIWQKAATSVRICCIKFAQRVILAQTSANSELRYGSGLEVSLDKIPPNHPNLNPVVLEAEAMGLLDRTLAVLQDVGSEPLVVDATLNCLSILYRARPGTSARILNVLLAFNPFKVVPPASTPKSGVLLKSMEKTTRLLLLHFVKRDPHNPQNPRIQQHIEKLMRYRVDLLEESKKRSLTESSPPHEERLEPKRQRIGVPLLPITSITVPPLAPGPKSLAEIFTLTLFEPLSKFDVSQIPCALAARISISSIERLDPQLLQKAVDGVRGRLITMAAAPAPELDPNTAPLGVDDDDDEYEPDFYMAEDTEQILNRLDSESSGNKGGAEGEAAAAAAAAAAADAAKPFKLPRPPFPSREEIIEESKYRVDRIYNHLRSITAPQVKRVRLTPHGRWEPVSSEFYRNDRMTWVKFIAEIATRPSLRQYMIAEEDDPVLIRVGSVCNHARQRLYEYIMEDFRGRIDYAIAWLYVEWVHEWTVKQDYDLPVPVAFSEVWALKLLDGFLPYLTAQDKLLTRFLSESPHLSAEMLYRLKTMCRDPQVVPLALNSLLYIVMLRPPCKETALDVMQEIWTEYDDAKTLAARYLQKYRPEFLKQQAQAQAEATKQAADTQSDTHIPVNVKDQSKPQDPAGAQAETQPQAEA